MKFKNTPVITTPRLTMHAIRDCDSEELLSIITSPDVSRTYLLPDGLHLEVNLVDEGRKTEFMYAEIEYSSEEQALSWDPASVGLQEYLSDDVTDQPTRTMGAFWVLTRLKNKS